MLAYQCVLFHYPPLFRVELSWLQKNIIRYAYLPHIIQGRGVQYILDLILFLPQTFCYYCRIIAHPDKVGIGKLIAILCRS